MKVTVNVTWHIMTMLFVVILLVVGGFAFASFSLYSKIQATDRAQKALARKQIEEKFMADKQALDLIASQKLALNQSQTELAQAKEEALQANQGIALTSQQLALLSKKVQAESLKPKDIVITSNDIAPYTTGIVQVICKTKEGISSGSGTLWNFKDVPYAIVTNRHVIKDAASCVTAITNSANTNVGVFAIKDTVYSFNNTTDSAVLEIGKALSSSTLPLSQYNYKASQLPLCTSPTAVGIPIVIVGYPVYAKRDAAIDLAGIGQINVIYRTVTNGIISGYDSSLGGTDPNYFVSAKIDSGNSGGLSIAKDTKGLCMLGIPTWLTVGNYETQGLVQNIVNILPVKK
jgi:hypothetical protein